jgi:hypothetical protein
MSEMMKVKLIFFILLTMSLGFHVPSDAFAADTWTDATTTNVGTTNMNAVSMSDANNGVAVGNAGAIVYTTNGGVDWTDATTTNVGATHMRGVSMIDANNGVAVGDSGQIVFTASVSSEVSSEDNTTTSGGGGKNNCDSNGFGNNNSLKVYQVTYNIKTYEVQVQAYSTCGSVSAKMTTPMQQSVLGLSTEQTLLDDRIAIYWDSWMNQMRNSILQFKTKDILLMKHFTSMTNL